jgi:hypothetical protein
VAAPREDAVASEIPVKRDSFRARWGWEIVLVLGLAGVVPLLGPALYHSFGQPSADDWTYLNALAHLTQHGTLNFNHWGTTTVIGQLLLVAPLYLAFGVHPVLATLAVWVFGFVGIFGLSYLCRRCGMTRRAGAVVVASITLCPLFLTLDVTFMTDVTCFSAMILALCFWVDCRDIHRFTAKRWMALGFATLAFSIREPAAVVAVPVLVEPLVAAWRGRDRRALKRYLAISACWSAAVGALWLWREGNPTSGWVPQHLSLLPLLRLWFPGWLPSLLGLFALPILMKAAPWELVPYLFRHHGRAAWILGVLVVAMPLGDLLLFHPLSVASPQLGNYYAFDQYLPVGLRFILYLVGLLSLWMSLLVYFGGRSMTWRLGREQGRALVGIKVVVALYAAVMVGLALSGLPVFDRYWLVILALNAVVLDRSVSALLPVRNPVAMAPSLRRWTVPVAVALVGFFAMTSYVDKVFISSAIWNVATTASHHLPSGFGPEDIAADWQWDEYTYTLQAPVDHTTPKTHDGQFLFLSHDPSDSFVFQNQWTASTCAPFAVEVVDPDTGVPRGAIAVGPTVYGFFISAQLAVVPVVHPNCATQLRDDRRHLLG